MSAYHELSRRYLGITATLINYRHLRLHGACWAVLAVVRAVDRHHAIILWDVKIDIV